ncbi:hypothetical protein PBI_SEBATA_100 [Mycobacterium phage Sebata]|uniref:Uncharacterized protein n=23 Tax=Bixzunavirus TaxID=680114 RepID=A0A411CCB6_9CAUD|nr:hypothetical protein SCOTTMCG_95 [Mycobacterium phage ScottMcG]YP_002224347.1 gp98 [Mycobacterium phage Spud]YP_003347766.1 hypothetical protein ET08_87 [Mycobacterium phage ET08]YP_009012879.1 hypothetical protein DANDELION_105 [Mycobacterium phage Dandelion]YP_009014687.1 hypothetical protein LINSTU_98 [Mycobacterium phage LinStu]YP_009016559.1 hypothetical protein NAPPY_101 [Mycobacterium phage Nappy]YP_009204652.1 hypothetical protein HYRO_90 [Mycobacterium phage HyRo]YP_009216351.1 h
MTFRPPASNPGQKRTLVPRYANTQATPWAGFLDPDLDVDFDILPGTVMQRLYGDVFAPYTGEAGTVPFGLSALFHAPRLGVTEVSSAGTGLFTVWVGDSQAVFDVLAPAFDVEADWPAAGETGPARVMLTANSKGRLTPDGVTPENVIAELIDIPSTDKITIRLNRLDLAATGGGLAGGS